jgi:hypothetical protein
MPGKFFTIPPSTAVGVKGAFDAAGTRTDFSTRLQGIIDAHNVGSSSADNYFAELVEVYSGTEGGVRKRAPRFSSKIGLRTYSLRVVVRSAVENDRQFPIFLRRLRGPIQWMAPSWLMP